MMPLLLSIALNAETFVSDRLGEPVPLLVVQLLAMISEPNPIFRSRFPFPDTSAPFTVPVDLSKSRTPMFPLLVIVDAFRVAEQLCCSTTPSMPNPVTVALAAESLHPPDIAMPSAVLPAAAVNDVSSIKIELPPDADIPSAPHPVITAS